jgi:hypothetical protein
MTLTNVDLVNNNNLAFELQDNHATIDSSILTQGIFHIGTSSCTITNSRGPTQPGGDPCETYQTTAVPSFVDSTNNDYHLTAVGNAALIDHGNPAPPPPGATDPDGDPRAIDSDGSCPLTAIRDIGADEFNPGIPSCPPPVAPTFTGTTPASPANDNDPLIQGSATTGTTVQLYTDAACTSAIGEPMIAAGSAFGIPAHVADNSTTTFHATASNANGPSVCSPTSITYVEQTPANLGGGGAGAGDGTSPTGQRAAALRKCKRKHGRARKRCKKKAKRLPV